MSNDTAKTVTTNIVPVQGTFEPLPPYKCIDLIGPAGTPFFAPVNPDLDGVSITNSTINSTTIGQIVPAVAQFTTASSQNQPIGNNDLTTKLYVDSLALGISWKQPVNAGTTGNITLSGQQTIDTVPVVAGDRVLVKNQTLPADNGIYVAATGAWSRSPDADTYDEMISALVFVESGGQAGAAYYCPIQPGGTLGVTAITWNNFSVGGVYFAGTGLNLSGGDTFNISNTTVAAAGYGSASAVPTFTVNAQGQLTAAANVNIALAGSAITSGTIDSGRLSGSYSGITGVGTLTDLTVSNVITGSVSGSAATATTATNLAAGAAGSIPFQSGAGTTTFLAAGLNGQVLTLTGGVPTYATPTSGTVTSVSGTGTVSGISLSGTVTSTGDLTLGGTLDLSSPPVIGNTAPNTATFTTVNASTFDTNAATAGVTLSGTTLAAYGSDTNIDVIVNPKGTGGLGVGGNTTGVVAGNTITSKFCVKHEGPNQTGGFVHVNNTTAASGAGIFACRSRGTLAAPTIVQNNDTLSTITFAGNDGVDLALAARISVEVDGTPGSNDMPGRMVFLTTPNNSQSLTEAMRIDSTQTVTIPTASMTNATVTTDLNLTGTLSVNGSSGTAGYVLTSNGASDPTWEPNANGLAIVDDTTTNATRYLTFTSATTGNITTENVASTKLQFNPSTGVLSPTSVSYTGTLTGGTGVVNLGSGQFYKDASGNVGIGTSSPYSKLRVEGTAQFTGDGSASPSSGTGIEIVGAPNGAENRILAFNRGASTFQTLSIGASDITFATGATTRMTIDSAGDVTMTGELSVPAVNSQGTPAYLLKGYVYLTSGTAATYTTPTGVRAIEVEVIGAGGGGGGTDGTDTTSSGAGGTGGGGGYARALITSVADSYTYTVGAGGAGGAAGNFAGAAGGATTFTGSGITISATGGSGGPGNLIDASNNSLGGAGGQGALTGVDGDVGGGIRGGYWRFVAVAGTTSIPFARGFCPLIGGSPSIAYGIDGAEGIGTAGALPGEGGNGSYTSTDTSNRAGGAGFRGRIKITEYY